MLSTSQEKRIRALHSKKQRQKLGLFIAEGDKLIAQLLNFECILENLFCVEPFDSELSFSPIQANELKRLSLLEHPANSLAVFQQKKFNAINEKMPWLFLDSMRDPGNLGNTIRTAAWFGIKRIYASLDTTETYNPKVVQASMGGVGFVDVVRMDPEAFIEKCNNNQKTLCLSHMDGQDSQKWHFDDTQALIIGNESRGISQIFYEYNHLRIAIKPMTLNTVESLNASTAAALLMARISPP